MNTITVKKIEDIDAYAGPHAIPGIRFRPARDALGVSSFGMSVLELDPHCSSYPEHDHADDGHEEVYLVLRGSIVLRAAGEERTLQAGEMVRVPGNLKRKFVTGDQGAIVLALGGTPGQAYAPSMGRSAG